MTDDSRPTLVVQTVYFAPEERELATELGELLYEQLTRPRAQPLAFGPNIPVRVAVEADEVETDIAEHVLLVPIVGAEADEERWSERARAWIAIWSITLGAEHVVVAHGDSVDGWRGALIEVVGAACRLLIGDARRLELFVSQARPNGLAMELQGFAFFDVTELRPGDDLDLKFGRADRAAVLVAVRSEGYGSNASCQREMQYAKAKALPILTVDMLDAIEPRGYAYAGNAPSIRWNGDTSAVILRAFVEWLAATHFEREAPRISQRLPPHVVLARAPELFDLVRGKLHRDERRLVLHPDPELGYDDQSLLREVRPRLELVTPSTRYRHDNALTSSGATLSGKQIALSLSASPIATAGITSHHVQDVVVTVARTVISTGAALAYGGDFRVDGFDELLEQLILTYNASGVDRAAFLHSYLSAFIPESSVEGFAITAHSLAWTNEKAQARLSPPLPTDGEHRFSMHVSDMRRLMNDALFARVAIGGQVHPRTDHRRDGYSGLYPGIVEEAYLALRSNKPLYVIGGFGGAARIVARLLDRYAPIPDEMLLLDSPGSERLRRVTSLIALDPEAHLLELPADLRAMAEAVRDLGTTLLADDETAQRWNGLTVAQNHELFRARDPVLVASLVMEGLTRVVANENRGKLQIEVVRGDISRASADAIAIATFDAGVPVAGAGAALDARLSNAVSNAVRTRERIIEIPNDELDASCVVVSSLGRFEAGDLSALLDAVERAASEVAATARARGFKRIALVTFGGNSHGDLGAVVERMLKGLATLAGQVALQWFEFDQARFKVLREVLERSAGAILTARELEVDERESQPVPADRDLILGVRYESKQQLAVTIIPAAPDAPTSYASRPLVPTEFAALARPQALATPSLPELDSIGDALTAVMTDEVGRATLATLADRIVVVHDPESAPLPFETLRVGGRRLALDVGIVRRPTLTGLRPTALRRPPRVGALKLTLVVDPLQILPAARTEADAIMRALADRVEILELAGASATCEAVVRAFADPTCDIVHYCGQLCIDAKGTALECADGRLGIERLEITGARVAFLNTCGSARLTPDSLPDGSKLSVAELFLRAGVEAFIGTMWPVADKAAAEFAGSVYRSLGEGETLDHAVRMARRNLHAHGSPDWANYVLYGDGRFRLTGLDESKRSRSRGGDGLHSVIVQTALPWERSAVRHVLDLVPPLGDNFLRCFVTGPEVEDLLKAGLVVQLGPSLQYTSATVSRSEARIEGPLHALGPSRRAPVFRATFIGPLDPMTRTALADRGATLLARLGSSTYSVRIPRHRVNEVAALPFVRALDEHDAKATLMPHDDDELQWNLELHDRSDLDLDVLLTTVAADPRTRAVDSTPWGLTFEGDVSLAEDLASLPDVALVEPVARGELYCDVACHDVGLAHDVTRLPWTGAGQIVAVADSGIDHQHQDFGGRIVGCIPYGHSPTAVDTFGHGTHVAGIIAGSGAASGNAMRGAAPDAALLIQQITAADGSLAPDLQSRFKSILEDAWSHDARIHNHSWGLSSRGGYAANARVVDQFVYTHEDFLVVAAAGNAGPGNNTLSSLASALNALTVGAVCTSRSHAGACGCAAQEHCDSHRVHGPGCVWPSSGRGSQGERPLKPDVVAPGVQIIGPRSASAGVLPPGAAPHGAHYLHLSGTSMAAPFVAGLAARVRQYYIQERRWHPSACLVKATIINGATFNAPDDANGDNPGPDNEQGFGLVDAACTLPLADDSLAILFVDVRRNDPRCLAIELDPPLPRPPDWKKPPESFEMRVRVRKGERVRATLCVLSPSGPNLNQVLSLQVREPGEAPILGNGSLDHETHYDRINAAQRVEVTPSESGVFQFYVIAVETSQEPQAFALVVAGRGIAAA